MDLNAINFFGHVEIVSTEWREGDDLVLGGYSIERDRHGREVSRTKNVENCRMVDYYTIMVPRKSLWQRFADAIFS